jgi:hypothetical protein
MALLSLKATGPNKKSPSSSTTSGWSQQDYQIRRTAVYSQYLGSGERRRNDPRKSDSRSYRLLPPPFLYMKLYWDEHDELAFMVYRKTGQQLKYLNNNSTYPPHVFRAILLSVYTRLANLTSYDSTIRHKTIRELHPDHYNALDHAKLSSKEEKSPTLHYMKQCIDLTYSKKELKKQKDTAKNRGVYFCIGYSTFWKKPIHLILKDLKLNTSYNG